MRTEKTAPETPKKRKGKKMKNNAVKMMIVAAFFALPFCGGTLMAREHKKNTAVEIIDAVARLLNPCRTTVTVHHRAPIHVVEPPPVVIHHRRPAVIHHKPAPPRRHHAPAPHRPAPPRGGHRK